MNFTRANLTDAGLALNAKIQAATGDVPLLITRVALGAGTSQTPTSQTDVVNPIDFFVPIIRQQQHGAVAEIQIQITNVGNPDKGIPPLSEPLTFQQIGFWAIDPDMGEILYRISQLESAAFIPPAMDFPYTVAPIYIFTTANAETVNITIDPAGLATVRMLGEHDNNTAAHAIIIDDLQRQIDALADPDDGLNFTTAIPITSDDYFGVWGLFANRGGIHAPLDVWGFVNATLITLPCRVEVDININSARVYAPEEYARQGLFWTASQQQDGVWILTATDNTSLILIRR